MARRPARLTAAAWLGLCGIACTGRARSPLPAGSPRTDPITFELALYYTPAPAADPEARLHALLAHDPSLFREVLSLLDNLFGTDDTDVFTSHDTPEVLAAGRKARAMLPALSRAFQAGFAPGEHLFVKAPFPVQAPFESPRGNEWMWVQVIVWQHGRILGRLLDFPGSHRTFNTART